MMTINYYLVGVVVLVIILSTIEYTLIQILNELKTIKNKLPKK